MFAPLLRATQEQNHELDLHMASRLSDGDPLVIDVVANVSGFLYIDYFSVDGTVVHLLPRPNAGENRIERGATLTLGRGGGTGTWPVGPPFATEMITAIVVPEPLFGTGRVELETAFSYREDLKRALNEISRRNGIGGISTDVSFVTIEPAAPTGPADSIHQPPAPAALPPANIPERDGERPAPTESVLGKPVQPQPSTSSERNQRNASQISGNGARCADILQRLQLGALLSDKDRTYLVKECGQ
jgi:hypothetical protein